MRLASFISDSAISRAPCLRFAGWPMFLILVRAGRLSANMDTSWDLTSHTPLDLWHRLEARTAVSIVDVYIISDSISVGKSVVLKSFEKLI